jgi:hypothetical protein
MRRGTWGYLTSRFRVRVSESAGCTWQLDDPQETFDEPLDQVVGGSSVVAPQSQ